MAPVETTDAAAVDQRCSFKHWTGWRHNHSNSKLCVAMRMGQANLFRITNCHLCAGAMLSSRSIFQATRVLFLRIFLDASNLLVSWSLCSASSFSCTLTSYASHKTVHTSTDLHRASRPPLLLVLLHSLIGLVRCAVFWRKSKVLDVHSLPQQPRQRQSHTTFTLPHYTWLLPPRFFAAFCLSCNSFIVGLHFGLSLTSLVSQSSIIVLCLYGGHVGRVLWSPC